MPEIKEQVLIVEDDTAFADLMIYWLEQQKYTCYYASQGKEAIELLQKVHFDLIITDLNMPDFDGFFLVNELRKLQEYAITPVIVISADNTEQNLVQILNEGADDFINKPFNEIIFISKVNANLKKANLKKSIYRKNRIQNISHNLGEILYCIEDEDISPALIAADFSIRTVANTENLFKIIENNLIWIILIDENARWAIEIIKKIKEAIMEEVPVLILEYPDSDLNKNIDYDYSISKDLSNELIVEQLRFLIKREKTLKDKYVKALNIATDNSAFSFARIYENKFEDYSVSIVHEPYANIPGGDFYEVFSYNDNYKVLFFGDVMGKTWGAWFFVPAYIAYIRSTIKFMSFRNFKKTITTPGKILEALNKYMTQDLRFSEVFTTLSVAVIDIEQNIIVISGAGSIAPLHYKHRSKKVERISVSGLLMGIAEKTKYESVEIKLSKGDKVLFYTDGYSESFSAKRGEMIGKTGMSDVFGEFTKRKSISALDLDDELINYFSLDKFDDDRSLMLISRSSK